MCLNQLAKFVVGLKQEKVLQNLKSTPDQNRLDEEKMKSTTSGILLLTAGVLIVIFSLGKALGLNFFGVIIAIFGILIATLGIKKLRAIPATNVKEKVNTKPEGIPALGALTLVSSIVLGFLVFFGLIFAAAFGSPIGFTLLLYLGVVEALSGFVSSILVLNGSTSKALWLWLLAYWIEFATGFFLFYGPLNLWRYLFYIDPSSSANLVNSLLGILFLPAPFVCSIVSVSYLLTWKAKVYFQVRLLHVSQTLD